MNILVTGGFGYIGSHFIKSLDQNKHNIFVIDDFSTGYFEALENENITYQICDIRNKEAVDLIFKLNKFDIVYDFAAKLIAPESVEKPSEYYDVNVNGLKNILDSMVKYNVNKIVFSSTAAVYGLLDKKDKLIVEEDPTVPSNPYGETKLVGERMIESYSKAYGIEYITFRYFNVVGSVKFGEQLKNITTVVPNILSAIKDGTEMKIFGGDYPTKDGTCIRDYIHIEDLISAHVSVLDNINSQTSGIYNLSIGNGCSVKELITLTEQKLNMKINHVVTDRRIGDPVISAADNSKFLSTFNWSIKYKDVGSMVKETYEAWNEYTK